jgi:hypothetical protein
VAIAFQSSPQHQPRAEIPVNNQERPLTFNHQAAQNVALNTMPAELLHMIIQDLDISDIRNLRLVRRAGGVSSVASQYAMKQPAFSLHTW